MDSKHRSSCYTLYGLNGCNHEHENENQKGVYIRLEKIKSPFD